MSARSASRVHVIVLNWRGASRTIACLDSLARLDPRPPTLVVDNGSDDGSVPTIRAAHPWVEVLSLPENVGFAAGMNAGIIDCLDRDGATEFVWLLNNDTIVDPDALDEMLRAATDAPDAAAIGCLLLDGSSDGTQAWGGGRIDRILWTTRDLVGPGRIDYITGASILLRVSALRQVGLFDERYFFYLEDADLGIRLRKAGWRVVVAGSARVRHARGATVSAGTEGRSDRAQLLYARAAGTFVRTHARPFVRLPTLLARILAVIAARVARRQLRIIPNVVHEFIRGSRRGADTPGIPWPRVPLDPRPSRTNTAAVVVTYHPDENVAERIAAIAGQVSAVMVVDNASSDTELQPLAEYVSSGRIRLRRNNANLGIATALNQGFDWAAENGFSWVVALDQDSLALPILLASAGEAFDQTAGEPIAVIGAGTEHRGAAAPRAYPVTSVITSGSVNSVSARARIGPFRDDFFIDYVDHDYCLRARAAGFQVVQPSTRTIDHRIGAPTTRRFGSRTIYPTNHSGIRRYYITRNRLWLWSMWWSHEPLWVRSDVVSAAKELLKILTSEEDRLTKMRWAVVGAVHFLLRRTGPWEPQK